MDITKIEEARQLFNLYEDVIRLHECAIIEHKKVTDKYCDFDFVEKPELHKRIEEALAIHFEGLKDKLKQQIAKL